MSAPRDKGTAAQQPALLKALENMLKRPENRLCVDCGATAPRWASTNLGVFMCIRCSGIHRSLGVHISKVKSVSLDKWSPEQVEFMDQMGNEKGNALYEAHVPSTYNKGDIRSENIALEQWIRDKYERKRFMAHGNDPRDHRREERYNGREPVRDMPREREPVRAPVREPVREREPEPVRREPVAPISRPQARNAGPGPVKMPSSAAPAHVPAPVTVSVAQSHDLVNWDEPARTPQQVAPVEEKQEDFFGDFSGATNGTGQAPKPDKNAILQLYNTPIAPASTGYAMPPGMHPPPQHFPGPNYNVHLTGGYPPNMGGAPYAPHMGYPPNMGRGAMPPAYYPGGYPPNMGGAPYPPHMGSMPPTMGGMPPMGGGGMMGGGMGPGPTAVPPGYFNKPVSATPPTGANYGTGSYPNYNGVPNNNTNTNNTNNLAGLTASTFRM